MTIELFAGVVYAVFFFRAADHERLNPWVWSIGSVGTTAIVILLRGGMAILLVAQAALFAALWWVKARRLKHITRQYTGG